MDSALGNRLIDLRARIVAGFGADNWEEIGLLTGATEVIARHPRLLRSLSWGDEDYAGNVLAVLRRIVEQDLRTLPVIEQYLDQHFPVESTFISAKPSQRRITFSPYVFQIPDGYVELDLVAVMIPFSMEFKNVHEAIARAAAKCGLRCLKADDFWEESTIIQDIFNLIFRAQVVIVDFTGRNQNVMYETGIAHTLGKHVVPIAQSIADIPFDMRHHRALKYLPNTEGLAKLSEELSSKLRQFCPVEPDPPLEPTMDEDDIPF
jgi:hypothetical protein